MFNLIYQGTSPIFQEQNGLPLAISLVEISEKSQKFRVRNGEDLGISRVGQSRGVIAGHGQPQGGHGHNDRRYRMLDSP